MKGLDKTIWILKRLGDYPFEMSASQIAHEMGHGRSGVFKILQALNSQGLVVQDAITKKYSVGPALYRLGAVYSDRNGIWETAKPVLEALANITQGTVSMGIHEGKDAILAYSIASEHQIRLHNRVGSKYKIHAGAIGKVMAAFQDEDYIKEQVYASELEPYAKNTITDPVLLLEEFAKIRLQGYAVSDEEHLNGSYGVAAPIFDAHKKIIACVCIAGTKEHYTLDKMELWIQLVVNAANEISDRLSYYGSRHSV